MSLVFRVLQAMFFYTLKLIKHLTFNGIRSLPIEILPFQQMLMNSLFNKTQLGPLMAQPFELIDMSDIGLVQFDTKSER